MLDTLRKKQRILMICMSMLALLAFVVCFHTYAYSVLDPGIKVGSIYGRSITQIEFDRLAGNYPLAVALGLHEFLEAVGGIRGDFALNEFVLNQIIIQHEAKALAVAFLDQHVAQAISKCPTFQQGGRFDVTRYREFVRKQLTASGMNERFLEEFFLLSLQVNRIRKIVSGSVAISDQEVSHACRAYQKEDLQVVKFDLSKYITQVHVSVEQMRQLYLKKSVHLATPETRSVRYVVFEIPKNKQLLKGKARISTLQVLADKAAAFTESLSNREATFETAAKYAGVSVNVLPPFDRSSANRITKIKELKKELPGLVHAVFQLTENRPYTSTLEGVNKDQFYIFELLSVQSARSLTFKEAEPKLREVLYSQAATKLLCKDGVEIVASIAKQLKEGRSFQEVATKLKIKPLVLVGITPLSTASTENALYAKAALLLSPGEISAFQMSPNGGAYAVFLTKREAIPAMEYEKIKTILKAQLLQSRQMLLFYEWMRVAREKANACIKSTWIPRNFRR